MTPTDTTAPAQTESLSFEFDLQHSPDKVWRTLTDPTLLAKWLLPVFDLKLELGSAFTFKTQAYPGWDGTVIAGSSRSSCTASSATRGASRFWIPL